MDESGYRFLIWKALSSSTGEEDWGRESWLFENGGMRGAGEGIVKRMRAEIGRAHV